MTEPTGTPAGDLRATLEKTLGDMYLIERELGGGGMSRVFLAEDRALERKVVVKVLQQDMAAGVSPERFRREIQLAAKLQHPHIVPLLSSGEIAGTPYFTMPFIDGESLRAHLAKVGELPVSEAVRILRHVASALSYAHKHGVVHRDIKPDNVMLADDFALVTDFGVAKALSASSSSENSSALTSMGLAIGTPAYMAPEQAVADPSVDHRADIYAWGTMAYEMLTGQPPFSRASPQATLAAQAIDQPDPIQKKRPGLPPALAALVMKCLEKRPADRPQAASELLTELDAIATSGGSTSVALPAAAPAPTGAVTPDRRKSAVPMMAGLAILALLAVGGFLYQRGSFGSGTRADGGELTSVAVLPLTNVGGDTASDYFSDGMTDELANALGKLPGLRVASRTSTYAFKGRKDADAAEIGRKLRVQTFLAGTVRRAGDRLRVTAQLTNVADGLELWSDSYERPANDVFKVQDDIARSIASALKLKLGAGAAAVSSAASNASRGTDNLEAYDSYLRGIFLWNRRGADNLTKAISHFQRAIAIDPHFGRAYAAMASVYALLPEFTDSPPPNVLQLTRDASTKALSIDTTLAEAHTALGLASIHAWDYPTAESEYRKAIALEPRYPTGHQWYGEYLFRIGKLDSAIAEINRAVALDPLAPVPPSALAFALNLAQRYDEALVAANRGLELAPNTGLILAVVGFAYLGKENYSRAVHAFELAAAADPTLAIRQAQSAYGYAISGDKEKARAVLAKLESPGQVPKMKHAPIALIHAGLGEKDPALAALSRAVDEHEISLTTFSLLNEHAWDSLRGDPRFTKILERMNLGPYVRR